MRIWVLSDLHFEFFDHYGAAPSYPRPACDLLLLAGDIGRAGQTIEESAVTRARNIFGDDLPIVQIAGNHEFYKNRSSVAASIENLYDAAGHLQGLGHDHYFLENQTIVLNIAGAPVRIIGATLWTDFRAYGHQMAAQAYAANAMNDFNLITHKRGKFLTPADTVEYHQFSRDYIREELEKPFEGKTIVMTHHLPSQKSVNQRFAGNFLNPAFVSNADDLLALGADLWVHGHTHDSCQYRVGKTLVVCNPHGYPSRISGRQENQAFDPKLVVEI